MEVVVFRALVDIGLANDRAERVVKALGEGMDKRVENGVNYGVSALRSDIAAFSGEISSKIATLTGEIKRLDEKVDKSIAHFRWAVGFVLVICSSAATVVWRFAD
jgi:hypothetical protein